MLSVKHLFLGPAITVGGNRTSAMTKISLMRTRHLILSISILGCFPLGIAYATTNIRATNPSDSSYMQNHLLSSDNDAADDLNTATSQNTNETTNETVYTNASDGSSEYAGIVAGTYKFGTCSCAVASPCLSGTFQLAENYTEDLCSAITNSSEFLCMLR